MLKQNYMYTYSKRNRLILNFVKNKWNNKYLN